MRFKLGSISNKYSRAVGCVWLKLWDPCSQNIKSYNRQDFNVNLHTNPLYLDRSNINALLDLRKWERSPDYWCWTWLLLNISALPRNCHGDAWSNTVDHMLLLFIDLKQTKQLHLWLYRSIFSKYNNIFDQVSVVLLGKGKYEVWGLRRNCSNQEHNDDSSMPAKAFWTIAHSFMKSRY